MNKWVYRAAALTAAWLLGSMHNNVAIAAGTLEGAIKGASLSSACGYSMALKSLDLMTAVADSLHMQPQLQIARANLMESKSHLTAARAALLPRIDLSAINELYKPTNGSRPFVVVDNTVLGGTQAISAYASLGLSWTLWSSGRNWAAYHAATAGIRAAKFGVESQKEDTVSSVLGAYEKLYGAEVVVRDEAFAVNGLNSIQARALRRYEHGFGTAVAVGRARVAALKGERTLNDACRTVENKSEALEQAAGIDLLSLRPLDLREGLPAPNVGIFGGQTVQELVAASPAVAEAKENIVVAEKDLRAAKGEFGPTISLRAQRDYLGQDTSSFGRANGRLGAADYRVDLSIEQPIFPLGSQLSAVEKARAQLRKARASYEEARLEAESKLATALSARRDAERSLFSARSSLVDADRVLALTRAQYRAGRTNLDNVQRAEMDRNAAQAEVEELNSRRALADWEAARVLYPRRFVGILQMQLGLTNPVGGMTSNVNLP